MHHDVRKLKDRAWFGFLCGKLCVEIQWLHIPVKFPSHFSFWAQPFLGPACFLLKTKRNTKWPQRLSCIAITGSVQQVERCSHPVGPCSTARTPYCQELWWRSCLWRVSVHSICVNSIPQPCWQSATVCFSHQRPVAWFTVWGQCHKSLSAIYYIHLCHKIESLFTLNCVPQVFQRYKYLQCDGRMWGQNGRATQIIFPWPWNDLSCVFADCR